MIKRLNEKFVYNGHLLIMKKKEVAGAGDRYCNNCFFHYTGNDKRVVCELGKGISRYIACFCVYETHNIFIQIENNE